jgi:hypothetical protein
MLLVDHADEIFAALVLGVAAVYIGWIVMDWRSAKSRREIENLNAQGRHILTIIADERK